MAKFTVESVAKGAGVSVQYLNNEISDKHVLDFTQYCPVDIVGPYLGLPQHVLDDINDDQPKKTELRRRLLLQKFKEYYAFEATYHKLVQALIDSERNQHAYSICLALAKEEKAVTGGSKGAGDTGTGQSDSRKVTSATKFEDLSLIPLDIKNFAEVFRSTLDVVEVWDDLGSALGLEVGLLTAIETDNANAKNRMKAMIKAWLQMQGKGPPPSWQTFCKALRDRLVGRKDIADSLEKEIVDKNSS